MRPRYLVLPAVLLLASCGDDKDLPPMVTGAGVNNERAEALYSQAQAAERDGKTSRAVKLYDELADDIPLAAKAPEARFRQAELLRQQGETQKSFDAYQNFLTRYQGSGLYRQALDAQAEMAFGAADGEIKNSFLGLKSKLSTSKITTMLGQVAANAPRSELAARAQFKTADLFAKDKETSKAVSAYRQVVENYPESGFAPEAQFRIGEILLEQARKGNQDQANLSRASEAFEDYLTQFPGHKRNGEARRLLASIGSRDVQNSFDIAEFYEGKGNISSAKFYYQEVMRKSKSGDLHERAKARLAALQ